MQRSVAVGLGMGISYTIGAASCYGMGYLLDVHVHTVIVVVILLHIVILYVWICPSMVLYVISVWLFWCAWALLSNGAHCLLCICMAISTPTF